MMFSAWVLSLLSVTGFAAAESYFFNNTGGLGPDVANISTTCADALQASIPCDGYFKYIVSSDVIAPLGNTTYQDALCNATCGAGFTSYRSSVASACANDPQPFDGLPATWWADTAISAFNQLCLKDSSSGEYCTDYFSDPSFTNASSADGSGLSSDQLCSECVVNLFRQMQATSYSNYDDSLAEVWSSIQSQCGLSYPTEVQPLDTNVTTSWGYATPGSAYNASCLSGVTYDVKSGDNCETIAEQQNVALGTLITINSLYQDCSNLLAGQTLCIPPTCTTYKVESGDTCISVANLTSTTFQQIIAWNPSINSYCTNLIADTNICVSPPGGVQNLTTIAGATVTQTAIYASATVPVPSPVASGTTKFCGKYYEIESGDYCQLVSVNQTIALPLFLAINPSINSTCGNLELGVYYCVLPTADWNATATSTIVTAPTTTPSGTTADCYEYYVIQSGDYCALVENNFDITFAQLQYWNPDILSDCSNLDLGEAYCVNGAVQPPAATTAAAKVKVKRNVARAGSAAGPVETGSVGGGVPVGWPGLNSPRMMANGAGAAIRRSEL